MAVKRPFYFSKEVAEDCRIGDRQTELELTNLHSFWETHIVGKYQAIGMKAIIPQNTMFLVFTSMRISNQTETHLAKSGKLGCTNCVVWQFGQGFDLRFAAIP